MPLGGGDGAPPAWLVDCLAVAPNAEKMGRFERSVCLSPVSDIGHGLLHLTVSCRVVHTCVLLLLLLLVAADCC